MLAPQPATRNSLSASAGICAFIAAECFVFYQLMVQTSYAPVNDIIAREIGMSLMQSGLVSASFLVTYGLMQIPSGLLIDRFGPRWVLSIGVLLSSVSVLLFAYSNSMSELLIARACFGCASAGAFAGMGVIARRSFSPAIFALAIGVGDSALGLGGAIGEIGTQSLEHAVGWRMTYVWAAIAGVPIALACCFFLRHPIFGASQRTASTGGALSLMQQFRILRNCRAVWIAAIIYGGTCGTLLAFGGFWNIPLQEAWGWSKDDAVLLNTMFFVGVAVGAPLAGWLGEKFGARRLLIIGLGISGFAYLFDLIVPVDWPLWCDAFNLFLIGFGLGSSILAFAIATDAVPASIAGLAIAIVNFAGIACGAVFQLLPALIVSRMAELDLRTLQLSHSVFVVGMLGSIIASFALSKETVRRDAA